MILLVNKRPAEGMTLNVKEFVANEIEQNFIKTRMEKFGETEEQARDLFNYCLLLVAARTALRASRLMANYLKAIK
jgi:hypothetical protein